MKVVFTDPLAEWISNATKLGMETYNCTAQEISRELLDRTDIFATFECYPILIGNDRLWVFLRLLTAKMGVMFVESQRTFTEMVEEQRSSGTEKSTRLKSEFLPFAKVYGVNRQQLSRKGGELVFYHFVAEESRRQVLRKDCNTLKALHDSFPGGSTIGDREIELLASGIGLGEGETKSSIQRMFLLYRLNQGDFGRRYSKLNEFNVFSKGYFLEPAILPAKALILSPVTYEADELLRRFHPQYLDDPTA
jgi:hypothetical protein